MEKESDEADSQFPEHPRHEPGNGVHNHHGRQLAPRQHIIADGDFTVDQMCPDPLVHPFVMTADQDELRISRQFFRHFLAETLALGGHQNDRHILSDQRNGQEARSMGSTFMTIPPPPP